MEENKHKLIGVISFRDVKVNIYFVSEFTNEPETLHCAWRARNPDSFYTGIMFINYETGTTTYPEGAVIPEQNECDREILPQFIISGSVNLTDDLIDKINIYLDKEYKRKNRINYDSNTDK